jgi:hypothetical protein
MVLVNNANKDITTGVYPITPMHVLQMYLDEYRELYAD